MAPGCCKHPAHCCGITGKGGSCRRTNFLGDPARCCLINSTCIGEWTENKQCQDGKGQTCSDGQKGTRNYRMLTSEGCKDVLRGYFLGRSEDINMTISRWMDRSSTGATHFIERVIHTNANCADTVDPLQYSLNSVGLVYASALMSNFIKRFNKDAAPLKIPSTRWSDTYHEVQEILYSLAMKYTIVMEGALYVACSEFTEVDLESSVDLSRWCGCHLKSTNYQPYASKFGLCAPAKERSRA